MSDPRPVPLETIRAALREDVDQRGLRSLARAVGMSPEGLRKFLFVNRRVYATTEHRVRDWFMQRGDDSAVDEATASVALRVLLSEVPEGEARDVAKGEVLDAVVKAHKANRRRAPGWVKRLREG